MTLFRKIIKKRGLRYGKNLYGKKRRFEVIKKINIISIENNFQSDENA